MKDNWRSVSFRLMAAKTIVQLNRIVAIAMGLVACVASNGLQAANAASWGMLDATVQTPARNSEANRPPDGNQYPDLMREKVPSFWPNNLPPPKWPDAHPDAKPDPGMDRIRYWEKLCRLEAGEFIYRKAENVEGVYLIRPYFADDPGFHSLGEVWFELARYEIEDPYLWNVGQLFWYSKWLHMSESYPFVEMPVIDFALHFPQAQRLYAGKKPIPQPFVTQVEVDEEERKKQKRIVTKDIMIREGGQGPFYRYTEDQTPRPDNAWFKFSGKKRDLPHPFHEQRVPEIKSKYGVYWRGISRPQDRQMGIGGSEVMVIDLTTNEIMAVHRGFVLAHEKRDKSQISWLSPALCPEDRYRIGPDLFIRRVLKSSNQSGWLPEQRIQSE